MTVIKEQKGSRPLRVFLSYAKADEEHARKLRNILSLQRNLRLFTMDALSAGEDWQSRLKSALSECDIFMVLLSPSSMNSDWVLQELGAAWGLDKPIIPVMTHPHLSMKMPITLSGVQWMDIKDFEDPETVHQLLERYEEMGASGHARD